MTDTESHRLLKAFIDRVKALEDEIADLRADQADVVKEAREAGFEGDKIRAVVRWLRRIEKLGRETVNEEEAVIELYRQAAEPGGTDFDAMMEDARDRALLKIFAPDDQISPKLNARAKKAKTAAALARAAAMARGGL